MHEKLPLWWSFGAIEEPKRGSLLPPNMRNVQPQPRCTPVLVADQDAKDLEPVLDETLIFLGTVGRPRHQYLT
eukprot:9469329-Pyramimonas_sp.AAC.1